MNHPQSEQYSLPNRPEDPCAAISKSSCRIMRIGPDRIARTAATFHGTLEWRETSGYVSERIQMVNETLEHLRTIRSCLTDHEVADLLQFQVDEIYRALQTGLPNKLPFLSNGPRRSLRIAAVMREWLLAARHTRHLDHLRSFLHAYQDVSPLYPIEIDQMAMALRLAVAEKCRRLPAPAESTHMELLPRLIEELADTCRLIEETDWTRFGEEIAHAPTATILGNHPEGH